MTLVLLGWLAIFLAGVLVIAVVLKRREAARTK